MQKRVLSWSKKGARGRRGHPRHPSRHWRQPAANSGTNQSVQHHSGAVRTACSTMCGSILERRCRDSMRMKSCLPQPPQLLPDFACLCAPHNPGHAALPQLRPIGHQCPHHRPRQGPAYGAMCLQLPARPSSRLCTTWPCTCHASSTPCNQRRVISAPSAGS